jgi:hypothetical protein
MNSNFDVYKFAVGGMLPTQENLTFKGANIDFGDYISPDTRLIASNAGFAQQTANARLEELMKQRQDIIDAVKLDKRFAQLEGQLTGQLDSLVEQASKSQLSDNANFTKFNTGLIKVKSDPAIKNALASTQYAQAYAALRFKNPEIADKPYLNGGNERDFQRFQNGETDEFVLKPIYKEPKWQDEVFKFVKDMPDSEKEVFRNLGSAVYQESTKGKSADYIKENTRNFTNYLLNSNPETAAHFKRMQQFGYNPLEEIQTAVNAAADQYKNESIKLSNLQRNPNDIAAMDRARLGIQYANLDLARQKADIAEQKALSGMSQVGGKGLQINKIEGRSPYQDQVKISNGNIKLNDEYKTAIAKTLFDNYGNNVNENNIILLDADGNTGDVTYQLTTPVKGGASKIETKSINLPYLRNEVISPIKTIAKPNGQIKNTTITQTDFNNKWSTLTPGQKLVGPDGVTYIKK